MFLSKREIKDSPIHKNLLINNIELLNSQGFNKSSLIQNGHTPIYGCTTR